MAQDLESKSSSSDVSDLCSVLSLEESDDEEEDVSYNDAEANAPGISRCPTVVLTGVKKKTPVLIFKADAVVSREDEWKSTGENYHLAYKMVKTECRLVRNILTAHGFHEARENSYDYNLLWTGSHLKPYVLRSLLDFQKVNHFPRSYEVTRKDRLYKNIQRMQQTKGFRPFDVVPQTFIIPSEYQDFCAAAYKEEGVWIVKPAASSRGRGIYLVTSPDQVSVDENVVICRYITNPFLINDFKFDVRLYVAVTSFDPLIIYLYEEGLTRFATVKFDKNPKSIRNSCMHLTNYSVNKKSSDYVLNDDADVEDFGSKWSLGALLRFLRCKGVDSTALMMSIEDVIIKTLISVEMPISSACKMFQPFRGNCFELFGFDILIDENLRPWVLEVNLSPSLACDAPLDLKIKSNMVSDLLSLVGVECRDPMTRRNALDRSWKSRVRPSFRTQSAKVRPKTALLSRRSRAESATFSGQMFSSSYSYKNKMNLSTDESQILRRTREEYSRRGGWVRIFPTPDTWDTYSGYLQNSTTANTPSLNMFLHNNLFNDGSETATKVKHHASRQRVVSLHCIPNAQLANGLQNNMALVRAMQRSKQYERKLICLGQNAKQKHVALKSATVKSKTKDVAVSKASLAQGIPEEIFPATVNPSRPTSNSEIQQKSKKEPICNIIKLLENGMTISKCQARFAFSTYLACIRQRLLDEKRGQQDVDADVSNEQMDLVLRFLQRAANNLQKPFRLTIPNSKLPVALRRQALAKQLGDFIYLYNKETEGLKEHVESLTSVENLDNEQFHQFVINAKENELEEVLTVFTKISKSASIFLRSSSKASNGPHILSAEKPVVYKISDARVPKCTDVVVMGDSDFSTSSLKSCEQRLSGDAMSNKRASPTKTPTVTLQKTLSKHHVQPHCIANLSLAAETGLVQQQTAARPVAARERSESDVVSQKCRRSNTENLMVSNSAGDDGSHVVASGVSLRRNSSLVGSGNYFRTQESMIEQSRALLEESKAKHHALIAQSHSIQRQLAQNQSHGKDCASTMSPSFLPKPPSKPNVNDWKHSSKLHRLVRPLSQDGAQHLDYCSDSASVV